MTFKKFLSVFVLTFFVKFGFGQVYQSMPQYGYGPVKRFDVDSTLTIPTVCGIPTLKSVITRKSAIAFDTCNNRFYYYNSKTLVWDTIKGGGSTIDTSNRFVNSVTKVNDSTIRVFKGSTSTDIVINPQATRLVTEVFNKTGSTILKGSVIYIDGKHSNNLPSIALAEANNENNSYKTFALVAENISNMSSGYIIQAGTITGLNLPTNTYTDGDILYLSPTVAGGFTTTKPLAPNHIVKLGSVVNAHPTQGRIEVKIENGWQLDELSDVSIASVPADSVVLQFSRVDSLWHDVSITNAIGTKYIKPSDTASLSNRINLRMRYTDTVSLSNRINTKLNTSDSSIYFTRFRSDTMRNNIYAQLAQELNISDSSIYFTRFRSDTMRTNIYTQLNGKQASGTYLTEDPAILAQQAMGSTIKGICVACRSFRDMTGQTSLSFGTMYITAYYLNQSATITGVKYYQQTQGVFTANNENRFGLYTYSGGVLTLVASSANNTSLWKGASSTLVSEPFSSTYSASPGLYFIVGLYNASSTTTNPALGHCGAKIGANVANGDFTNSARFTAISTSINTLPSSITMSTTSASSFNFAFFLY